MIPQPPAGQPQQPQPGQPQPGQPQPGQQPPPGSPPPGQPPAGGEKPRNPATPEEQNSYERVVLAAMRVLYGDATHDKVMDVLKNGADNPIPAISQAVVLIMGQVAEKAGEKMPRKVLLSAGIELLAMVVELGEKAGLFEVDEQTVQQAIKKTVQDLAVHFGKGEKPPPERVNPNAAQAGNSPPQGQPAPPAPPAGAGAAPQPGIIDPQGVQ
jgi:hypothetical protein